MSIELVSFPMTHGDFPWLCGSLPEGLILAQAKAYFL